MRINRLQEGDDAYGKFYGLLDYENKSVVDIGAEIGTTTNYFLTRGARKVYAYEINPLLKAELIKNFGNDPRVQIMDRWRGEPLPEADILKIDCETCEYMLTEDQIRHFSQWAIAIHRPRKYMKQVLDFQLILVKLGGHIIVNLGYEMVYVKTNKRRFDT